MTQDETLTIAVKRLVHNLAVERKISKRTAAILIRRELRGLLALRATLNT